MPVKPLTEIELVERELAAAMTAYPRDTHAYVSALEKAVTLARDHPGAAAVFDLAELLDLLAEEYTTLGRFDDALEAMRQALDADWRGQPDGRCRLAQILMRAGRLEQAEPIWAQVKADTPGDVWLFNNAGLEYAAIDEHETALVWLTEGLQLAIDTGDPEHLITQLLKLRTESLTALNREPDQVQAHGEAFLATAERTRRRQPAPVPAAALTPAPLAFPRPAPITRNEPVQVAWAWFPAGEYEQALACWPQLAEPGGPASGGRDHAAYCRAMQARLQDAAEVGMTCIRIAPIRIDAFLAWCAQQGEDPAGARAGYAADLARTDPGQLIAWPPRRNESCWCGSGRKYKKCCGAAAGR